MYGLVSGTNFGSAATGNGAGSLEKDGLGFGAFCGFRKAEDGGEEEAGADFGRRSTLGSG